jgi:DNA-binding PadR family transcriptional regulator
VRRRFGLRIEAARHAESNELPGGHSQRAPTGAATVTRTVCPYPAPAGASTCRVAACAVTAPATHTPAAIANTVPVTAPHRPTRIYTPLRAATGNDEQTARMCPPSALLRSCASALLRFCASALLRFCPSALLRSCAPALLPFCSSAFCPSALLLFCSSNDSYSILCYSCRMPPRRTEFDEDDPESFLPLPRDTFHILVSLADRERHGYSVMQDVAERTSGALRLSPSSLYAAIKRLLNQGLIAELAERPDPENDDERRRYYELTPLGRRVAKAEARRLERLLADARSTGLLPRRS